MALTRRQLIGGGAAAGLTGVGIYALVDRYASAPSRPESMQLPPEQHLLEGVRTVTDAGFDVLVPPLHHQVVTARLRVDETPGALRAAAAELEDVLASLDRDYAPTPAGLGVTVAWGVPYFDRYVPAQAARHIPIDLRASAARGRDVTVLEDAMRFPSDPQDTLLEANDVAVLMRSDTLAHIEDGAARIFDGLDGVFRRTSVRRGFAGGGFDGEMSLPKRMAMEAGIAGADLIPPTSELFLGFTSTQKAGLGPPRIANIETLGYADLTRSDYFAQGTHMHLSHLFEDVAAWYQTFDHRARVDTTFRPGLRVPPGRTTVPQGPDEAQNTAQVERDYDRHRQIGHAGSIQPASRLERAVVGVDGVRYPRGTAVPHRADFNTLDNPFHWTIDTVRDAYSDTPAAGLHFVVFNPTGDDFRRVRLAMDGVMPDGTRLPFERGALGQGFNQVLVTTHRQNYLVPPRRHRSFPLAELR